MRTRDNRQRFLIESCDVRGQICQLDDTWRDALARTDYPPRVRELLGEAFVSALLLAGTIKFDGRMTLQISGAGPLYLLVVQVTDKGCVRGLARWREGEGIEGEPARGDEAGGVGGHEDAEDEPAHAREPLAALFGRDARLVITIEARAYAEPYQGVVALDGERLSDVLANYFRDSEQLQTELFLTVGEETAAGMLLQKLPAGERVTDDPDGWRRASALGGTLSGAELRERDVGSLLHAVFHEERVRLFEESGVRFECSCSRERTDGMLEGLGESEVQDIIAERGAVEITCEFCDAEYRYDAVDVAALFHGTGESDSDARH